jgi:hypothetical protein
MQRAIVVSAAGKAAEQKSARRVAEQFVTNG